VGPPWRGAAGRTRQVTLCGELTDLLSNPARALAISRAPRRKNKEGAVTKRRPRADMDNDVVASFGSRYPMSALGRINAGNAQTAGSGLDRSAAGPPSLSFPVRPGRDRGMRLPRAAPAGLCLSLAGPLGSHKLKHRRRRHGRGGVRRVADRVVQRRRGGDAPGLYAAEQQLQPAVRVARDVGTSCPRRRQPLQEHEEGRSSSAVHPTRPGSCYGSPAVVGRDRHQRGGAV